jgi:predicted transcriptional regulator
MAKKVAALSEKALEVLAVLTASDKALTLAELKETVKDLNSSHLTALRNRNLVSADSVEKEVVTVAKRTVNVYTAVEVAEATDEVA